MNFNINPSKSLSLNFKDDGIHSINDKCYGICAAFSSTYDTYNMNPNCVKNCEELINKKKLDIYGDTKHQTPYRSVYWGQTPRFFPSLLKKGLTIKNSFETCMKLCENNHLSEECKMNCKLDLDSIDSINSIETFNKSSNIDLLQNSNQDTVPDNNINLFHQNNIDNNDLQNEEYIENQFRYLWLIMFFIIILFVFFLIKIMKKK